MSKANEDELALLHKALAMVLNAQLTDCTTYTDEDTGEEKTHYLATPALLNTVRQFLTDNQISCDPKDDKNINDLQDQLKKMREEGKGFLRAVGDDNGNG